MTWIGDFGMENKMRPEEKTATKNTLMLYLMNIAKMVFPLLTLPYLTRVLSVPTYGVVTYVKAVMQYMQLLMAFGFSLSATREIVKAEQNKDALNRILGDVQVAKLLLAVAAMGITAVLTAAIPILRENVLFVVLSFANVVITEMLADFLFRGINKMEVLTVRFVVAKTISTLCTFLFIKDDTHLLLIPLFDCIGSVAALILVVREVRMLGLRMMPSGIKASLRMLKESATFFVSEMATTAFGALNTILIGIYLDADQVAYWGVVIMLVGAVNSMYTPITNGIYPTMIRTKSLGFIRKILTMLLPVVIAGCAFCHFCAGWILSVIGGPEYTAAVPVFRCMIPVMLFSFGGMMLGWPALGAIGKSKETSATTVITALVQGLGLMVLIVINQFDLIQIALLRSATELLMLVLRFSVCVRFRSLFQT